MGQPTTARRMVTPERRFIMGLLTVATLAAPGLASGQDAGETAIDALTCWRRVDRAAVYAGERFGMTVTCRLVETADARTVLDTSTLEPEAIAVSPFEVLGGEQFAPVEDGVFRFLQYRYTLRLIDEGSFGDDVELPPLDLTYRIERRSDDGPVLMGRELTHILAPGSIRLLSLVPSSSVDIRDLPPPTFGEAEAGELRASLLTLLAGLAGILAAGVLALGIARTLRERRGVATAREKTVPPSAVVGAALDELRAVQETSGGGWTPDLALRALSALRLGGAVATNTPVAQALVSPEAALREGQLRVKQGWLRRRTLLVSSGTTADSLAERLPSGPDGNGNAPHPLGDALSVFTTARYGQNGALSTEALTPALDGAISHLQQLRWRVTAPVRLVTETTERLRSLAASWTR